MENAVLGGGCFWCLEAVFERLQGVEKVVSGYAGGTTSAPDYASVCTGRTGHAEVVKISFNPELISFSTVLDVFFRVHDPRTPNRQGNDVGTQYRSIIVAQSAEQSTVARAALVQAAQDWKAPLVTELSDYAPFFAAEAEHQGYFRHHPEQGYCAVVIAPKLEKARDGFRRLLKPEFR